MDRCPACDAPVVPAARYCAGCGHALSISAATLAAPASAPAALPAGAIHAGKPRAERSQAQRGATEGSFIPGTLLAGRYRLVGLLGRGGMGEVYRADDTRLGQTVALKFLPDSVARDAAVLERFYAEVRIGRQVSHPNVCRLYDLIEIEGHHCLSMEYVDGEDLSALLSRIGRLPADKAVEIARDLCAGLAAAHDKGVIHRDLKPANIMIDGKGRARIADFGIAALAEDIDSQDFAGTPAYLAPELLDGKPASVRSDLYALGLVLYEACTGKRLFDARSLAELKALQQATEPPSLSSSIRDIPPALERIVLHCLDRDPEARPASAHAVMAALPGGDPLQAAMAAGETPSPAMVAAAGKVGELRPLVAACCLLATLAGLLLVAWLAGQSTLIGRMSPEKSPELLTAKAREFLATLGHDQTPRDHHGSFNIDSDFFAYLRRQDRDPGGWVAMRNERPGPLHFVYRQSPGELVALRTTMRGFGPSEAGRITPDDPPTTQPGMIDLRLDLQGRLIGLHVVPTPDVPNDASTAEPDWSLLLAAAGLSLAELTPVAPEARVPVDSDRKAAWTLGGKDQAGPGLRIEAAALHGRPVWFELSGPGRQRTSNELPTVLRIAIWTVLIVSVFLWTAIAVLVRRNLRLGRGDRQGAWRLTMFLLASTLLAQMLRADHVALALEEVALASNLFAQVVLYALMAWLIYIALEPIARRQRPHLLVGWTRLLAGRWRDPLVGCDFLLGTLAGIGLALVLHLAIVLPDWLGLGAPAPRGTVISSLAAFRHLLYFMLWSPYVAVVIAFGTLLALILNRAILRDHWLALGMLALSMYFGFATFTGINAVFSLAGALFTALYLVVALRAGLLAAVICFYVFQVLEATPMTLDLSLWYVDRSLASLGLLASLAIYGFIVSLGGKPLLPGTLFDRDA